MDEGLKHYWDLIDQVLLKLKSMGRIGVSGVFVIESDYSMNDENGNDTVNLPNAVLTNAANPKLVAAMLGRKEDGETDADNDED